MSKTLELIAELIEENKIGITEVLESCGYKVDVVSIDRYDYHGQKMIGYDEKIIATKEFR
jgi:hypothetical protein